MAIFNKNLSIIKIVIIYYITTYSDSEINMTYIHERKKYQSINSNKLIFQYGTTMTQFGLCRKNIVRYDRYGFSWGEIYNFDTILELIDYINMASWRYHVKHK